ncbi:MAG TPA: radical SAM protein [Phycisphaerae bacterium]|nr:radical SAM protein [Phycisphaerae bacterium]
MIRQNTERRRAAGLNVLLLRPPRYLWPFNSETSAFWQPLGLLCLAAYARRQVPGASIEVWDCPGVKTGWRTLASRLADRPIDVLGIGEETVSAHEAVRAAEMVKRLWPECLVVAGGVYFVHTIEQTLSRACVDVVVRGEGEVTFAELLRHWNEPSRWGGIPGLAFRDGTGQAVLTPPRPLIGDLDSLPFPAYDLIDEGAYGRGSRNHPALVSIEHSRGCIDNCSFCVLWKHMGRSADGNGEVRPLWRTKGPERSFEEVRRLYRQYGRRTFGWVDPTFNVSPAWSDGWAERMLRSELVGPRGRPRTLHTAWLRADGVVRDERLGVLSKLVRAGLRQVMIGVERDDREGLAYLNKHNNDLDVCREAFAILRERHPQVYTIGTMIFGLPGDTLADLRRLTDRQYELGMDYCFLMPLTPNPGTAVAAAAERDGYVAERDLARYNFHSPVMRTDRLDLRQLESIYWRVMLNPSGVRLARAARQALFQRDRRKRRVFWALLGRGTTIATRSLLNGLFRRRNGQPALHSRRPPWYDD